MKKFAIFLVALFLILFIFYKKNTTPPETAQLPASVPAPAAETPRKPASALASLPKEEKKLSPLILSYIPSHAPAALKKRWSHNSRFEDDEYIGTQLTLDGKPVNNYFFRWSKDSSGNAKELVAGSLPQINSVKGSFPSAQESERIVQDIAANNPADILNIQEVWTLNSDKVMSPQLKVEVQSKSRTGRSSGHEIWMINPSSGDIVQRFDANRH